MKEDIYTLKNFYNTLSELVLSNAEIYRIMDIPKIKNGILLRHDLDSEIETALEVAKMEFGMGIKSTFYFLLTSEYYNILSHQGMHIIRSIQKMGHEIGLHFDPSIYENIDENFHQEINIMEKILDDKVYSFSVHNPSVHGEYPQFKGFISTYNKNLFSEKNYFSDSRFNFKGNIKEIIKESKKGLIQLLFHPTIYCIHNKNEPLNAVYIDKTIIERFGNSLIGRILKNPSFKQEVKDYPDSKVSIEIQLK